MSTTTRHPVRPAEGPKGRKGRLAGLVTTRRVVSSLALAGAAAALVIGFQGASDPETVVRNRPAGVLRVFPGEGAASLRQEPIGAQLADDLTGEIEVDGRPIPVDQTERPVVATAGDTAPAARGLSGLNQVSFTPGPGKDISSLTPGDHVARILYWKKVGETRDQAQSYSWTFKAT
jgi:hypothetical protein